MTALYVCIRFDVYRACDILKTIGNLKDYSDIIDRNQRLLNDPSTSYSSSNIQPTSPSNTSSSSTGGVTGTGIGTVPLCIKEGFKLQVLPSPVMLTKLNVEYFTMEQCAPILVSVFTIGIVYVYVRNIYQTLVYYNV